MLLLPNQPDGPAGARVSGTSAGVVLFETAGEVGRHARVERVVGTVQKVTVVHSLTRVSSVCWRHKMSAS